MASLARRLGKLEQASLSLLPVLSDVYLAEALNNQDLQVYHAARYALIQISGGCQHETSRRFIITVLLETGMRANLNRDFSLDLALDLDLDLDLALDRARNPELVKDRARELGLDPYDPDKIQAKREELWDELRALAAELAAAENR